jgi:hypothetical protein
VLIATGVHAAEPRQLAVKIGGDRFEIVGDGNTVMGLRQAPVPYSSLTDLADAVQETRVLASAVRLQRTAPPQVIDYVFCITDDGVLVVGQQIRTLDVASGQYVVTGGDIKRAYPALEATVPWTWIVDIPLAREVPLTLELKAMTQSWPVRAVAVTPRVDR